MIIVKRYHFYAAHRNKLAGEKCGRIHGHTYDVVVHLRFESVGRGGVTVLFSEIDNLVEPVVKQFDHYLMLKDDDPLCQTLKSEGEPFKALNFHTSAENLAAYFFNEVAKLGLPVCKIELSETKSSTVIYEA